LGGGGLTEINYDKKEEPICRPIGTDCILDTGVLPARSTFIYYDLFGDNFRSPVHT